MGLLNVSQTPAGDGGADDHFNPEILRIAMQSMFIAKENREAAFLTLSPEERYNDLMNTKPEWINRIPLKYLASYLGLTAETISRIRACKLAPGKKG